MKKIFLIILLFFFNLPIVYSKIITFKNCFPTFDVIVEDYKENYILPKKFDKNLFEEVKYEIDLEKKEIKSTVIITDNYQKKGREYNKKWREIKTEHEKKTGEKLIFPARDDPKKIDIKKIPISFIEKNYIISIDKSNFSEKTLTFYLNEKKIDHNLTDKAGYNSQGYIQCE